MLLLRITSFFLFALVKGSENGEDFSEGTRGTPGIKEASGRKGTPGTETSASEETERVVGGQSASNGMFPWTVALYRDDEYVCTASVISETAVLTAAHCVVFDGVTESANNLYGVVGVADRNSSEGTRIFFNKVTPHPRYSENLENDLAILQTDAPIDFTKNVHRICIAPEKIGSLLLKRVVAMGWGKVTRNKDSTNTPDVLQFVNQRVVSNLKCKILFLGNAVPANVLCASGILSGICDGDSGGPLVYYQGKLPIQVGVASFTNDVTGCGRILGPAGFVRLSAYTNFIKSTASGKVCVA